MSPIVIAALPITDDLNVLALLSKHQQVISGLLNVGIHVASYSCGGTETECALQCAFIDSADSHITVKIPSPRDGFNALSIQIPVFSGHPIAMIQDSKHTLKTFRSNLFSGARLLVLGNHVALYQQIRDMAFENDSPLYHRDVEKLDCQDDNAAARLFSAPMLQFLSQKIQGEQRKDLVGVAVYLFVFGELCDAYQNCRLEHSERILLLLRARYFMDTWKQFIESLPCYTQTQYFLSREAVDIVRFLVNGLLSLIIIHRDYYPETPLLPWLHSTEPCEHLFGLARQIVADFTLLDLVQMMPKIEVQLREALLHAQLSETKDSMKAHASGYHHTYTSLRHLDLMALGSYPSDSEIHRICRRAADEAESLWAFLGVYPQDDVSDTQIETQSTDDAKKTPAAVINMYLCLLMTS